MTPGNRRSSSAGLAASWLARAPQGAQVLATAHQLLALEGVIRGQLPPALAARVHAATVNRQHLTLAVPGSAYASKLRQLAPSLLGALNQAGWNLTGISVRIQASLGQNETKLANQPRMAQPLGETALQAFDALKANVQPGPLADAIDRLLKHHRG